MMRLSHALTRAETAPRRSARIVREVDARQRQVLTTRPEGDHVFRIVPRADNYSVAWMWFQRVQKKWT